MRCWRRQRIDLVPTASDNMMTRSCLLLAATLCLSAQVDASAVLDVTDETFDELVVKPSHDKVSALAFAPNAAGARATATVRRPDPTPVAHLCLFASNQDVMILFYDLKRGVFKNIFEGVAKAFPSSKLVFAQYDCHKHDPPAPFSGIHHDKVHYPAVYYYRQKHGKWAGSHVLALPALLPQQRCDTDQPPRTPLPACLNPNLRARALHGSPHAGDHHRLDQGAPAHQAR